MSRISKTCLMMLVGIAAINACAKDQLAQQVTAPNGYTIERVILFTRRAYRLVQLILMALSEQSVSSTTPTITAKQNLIVLTGHDTNLSNLAGVFGLDWHLNDQPDVTSPGTTIAFERWRNSNTGKAILKVRLFYQTMEQVRQLSDEPIRTSELQPAACKNSSPCELDWFVSQIKSSLPKDCIN